MALSLLPETYTYANSFPFPISPFVVVNSVCPGMTYTEMALPIASRSWFHNLCVYLTNLITAKTPDSGSRIIVQTAVKPKEYHVSNLQHCPPFCF